MLGIVAAETVPQTAQGFAHQLQVVGLPKRSEGVRFSETFPLQSASSSGSAHCLSIQAGGSQSLGCPKKGAKEILTPRCAVGPAPFPTIWMKPLL